MNYNTKQSHRPNRWARLKAKLAKANQEAEDARRSLIALQNECDTYISEFAAVYETVETQNSRIINLIRIGGTLTAELTEILEALSPEAIARKQ